MDAQVTGRREPCDGDTMRIVRYYPRAAEGDGGMTSAVRQWSEAFARAGVAAAIAFDRGSPPTVRRSVDWVQVTHCGPRGNRIPRGLGTVLTDADLMVLHSGWTLHNLKAGVVARRMGVPYVLEPRGAYDPHIVRRKHLVKRAWWAAAEKELVDGAAAIHIFFEAEREHLQRMRYEGPVIVASNGVAPQPVKWTGDDGYVLWLGRFDPEHKGLDVLLNGLSLIPPEVRPTVRLHGPDWRGRKSKVARMVDDLELSSWALLGEPVYGRSKKAMLARCGAFIYPSRWDACPNAVLESVAMGVPTITTPYPLGRYLAARGASVLAGPTAGGIADALMEVPSSAASRVGNNGAAIASSQLRWDRVARSWLSQFASLV